MARDYSQQVTLEVSVWKAMRPSLAVACLLLLSGCTNTTTMIQDGNAWIQKTEEGGWFGQKVVHVKRCLPDDRVNGFCREHGEHEASTTSLVTAPGVQLISSLISAGAIVGGTALLMHGLQTQAVAPASQVFPDTKISTFNSNVKYVPIQ